ncbi:MAG: asparagine--tRNA ligase [Candidatus Dadabacteria bacterium]|nr:MAG: asparagine--tRNA ligase [Candidatus Dadabacteria bacterium]
MQDFSFKDIENDRVQPGQYTLSGWVKTHRQSKNVSFIELSDGSAVKGLQLVIEPNLQGYSELAPKITTGSAITVTGELVESPARGQKYELKVSSVELVGEANPESYPLQKKGHTLEFLREILHLRPRSNTLGAVFRIRSRAALAVHQFFQDRGFVHVHAPIITASDCEGAGALFRVTTLDPANPPRKEGKVDFGEDFFGCEAFLSVSGQLQAEVFAQGLTKAYTFAPTFRAENSNTARHLAEFWMIEPEVAFCDLEGNMKLGREFISYLIKDLAENCAADLEFLHKRDWVKPGLMETLLSVAESDFAVLDYSEAIKILEKSSKKFEFPVKWGMDLQAEHERYLTDQYIKGPLYVINYPKEIKAFYMRLNDDGKTVRAMDMLVPKLGEIIGGSQREERYDVLLDKIRAQGLPEEHYDWYLDLRKYGSTPHSGFGLGFERFLMYVTGMQNIRDVIPFPRYPGHARG